MLLREQSEERTIGMATQERTELSREREQRAESREACRDSLGVKVSQRRERETEREKEKGGGGKGTLRS